MPLRSSRLSASLAAALVVSSIPYDYRKHDYGTPLSGAKIYGSKARRRAWEQNPKGTKPGRALKRIKGR